MITASRIQYLVIVVAVYDDRIEISNPGGLLPQVAENFGHKSLSRNPFIFKLFTRMQLVEKVGSGIPRMIGLMKDSGLKEPIFRKDGMFSISFPKITAKITKNSSTEKNDGNVGVNADSQEKNEGETTEKTSPRLHQEIPAFAKKTFELIENNPRITIPLLAEIQGISERSVLSHIAVLKNAGFLARVGGRTYGHWIVLTL